MRRIVQTGTALSFGIFIISGCGSDTSAPSSATPMSLSIGSPAAPATEDGTQNAAKNVLPANQKTITQSPQSEAVRQLVQRASDAVVAGNAPLAVEALSQGIGINPEDAQLFRMRADVYVLLKELANARADYSTAVRLDPQSPDLYNQRGYFLMSQGISDEAAADFDKCLQLNPQHAAAANNRGLVALARENYDEAIRFFDQALVADRRHADAWNNRGFVKMKQKQFAEALNDVQKAIELRPDYATAWNNVGLIHMQTEKYEDAEKAFTKLIELSPMDVRWFNHRRAARLKMQHFAEAQQDAQQIEWLNGLIQLTRSTSTTPSESEGWIRRGEYLMTGSQYGAAIQDFTRALILNPGDPDALTGRAIALMNTGDLQKAMVDCDESIVAGASTKAYSVRGDLWMALKNYDQAIADFEAASRFDDRVAEAYELRAAVHQEAKDSARAEADLNKAKEIRAALNGELRKNPATAERPAPFPEKTE